MVKFFYKQFFEELFPRPLMQIFSTFMELFDKKVNNKYKYKVVVNNYIVLDF